MEREILVGGLSYRFARGRTAGVETISISGKTHSVRYWSLPDGRRLCIVDGKVVEWDGSPNGSLRLVRIGGRLHHLEVADPRRRRGGGSSVAGSREGRAELLAPMAGKVVSILCEEGQAVKANQGVVVLEAMKMENELRSPIAGSVTSLEVKRGEAVETGQRVAVVENLGQED